MLSGTSFKEPLRLAWFIPIDRIFDSVFVGECISRYWRNKPIKKDCIIVSMNF